MGSLYINQQAKNIVAKVLQLPNFTWLIGVGASAGGVETLKELLLHLPEQLINVAFFIGFPIDKNNMQLLLAAIDANSSFSLKQAKQGEEIQSGNIYYCGPGYELDLKEARLQLNTTTEDVQSMPVDKLFKSLSVTAGEKSIAIVLSGMGADAAQGIKMIKEAGGYVIVQAPPSAMYNALPLAAIKTNCANLVIPPFQIGKAIWDAVQLQQARCKEHGLTYEPVNETGLQQTAMDVTKTGATNNSGSCCFPDFINRSDDILSINSMVKETIFDCYQHTYLVVDTSFVIKEIKGDADLFIAGLTDLTNQHLWSVISKSKRAAVKAEIIKATASLQVVKSNVEMIGVSGELFFMRIIVKPLLNKSGSIVFYLIIFENLQPEKFDLKELPIMDTNWA